MGRAKLNMDLIADKKSRNTTFNNRKDGLIKKTQELATLCDVSACIIIYAPKQETGYGQPATWPRSADEVRGVVADVYESPKNKDSSSGSRTFGLKDFFDGRKRKVEGDLTKLRKKNMEAVYPTRPEVMNNMHEAGLREFEATLGNKLEYVKSRIELLRIKKQGLVSLTQTQSSHRRGGIQIYPTTMDQNYSMMSVMNGGRVGVQFGAGPSDFQGRKPMARHYGPELPVRVPAYMPVVPTYMQMMVPSAPRLQELQLWRRAQQNNNGGQEDVVVRNDDQYEMNYKRARYYYNYN